MAASSHQNPKSNSLYIRPVHEGFSIDGAIKIGFFSFLTEVRGNGYRLRSVKKTSETSLEVAAELYEKSSNLIIEFSATLSLDGERDISIHIEAAPSGDIRQFKWGCFGIQLPGAIWKNGSISFGNSSLKIIPYSDGARSLGSHTLSNFSIETASLPQMKVLFSIPSDVTCDVVDTRNGRNDWSDIEIRLAQFGDENFIWHQSDKKTFDLSLHFEGGKTFEIQNNFDAKLSENQKKDLHDNGFVKVSGLIDPRMISNALRAINIGIVEIGGKTSRRWDVRKGIYMGYSDSWTSKYQSTPMAPMINESLLTGVLAELFGLDKLPTVSGGQISLIFPDDIENPIPLIRTGYHIDGEPNVMWNDDFDPSVKYEAPKLDAFTAVIGVYLKDILEEDSGNFAVYPGSHFAHAEYFREHGPDSILNEHGKLKMPIPIPDLHPPVQLCCRAGDVVIVHYLTAHTMACNFGPDIRYAVYFRVTVNDFEKHRMESLTEAWRDWPGLAAAKKQN